MSDDATDTVSEEEDYDDIPLTLAYDAKYEGGSAPSATSLALPTLNRPPLPGLIIKSSFASIVGAAAAQQAASPSENQHDQPAPALQRPQLGSSSLELSFNATATPEREGEPLPSSRQHATAVSASTTGEGGGMLQAPSFRLSLPMHAADLAAHASAGADMGPSMQPPAASRSRQQSSTSSPAHASPGAGTPFSALAPHAPPPHHLSSPAMPAPSLPTHSSHPPSHLRSNSRESLPPAAPPLPPHIPALPLLRTSKPPRLHLENPATASPVMSPLHTTRMSASSLSKTAAAAAASAAGMQAVQGVSLVDLLPPHPQQQGAGAANGSKRLLVSLLSPAFSIAQPNNAAAAAAAVPPATAASATAGAGPQTAASSAAPAPGRETPVASPPGASAASPPGNSQQQPSLPHIICSSLGLQQSHLRCFTLQEVTWEQLGGSGAGASASPGHVAVLVEGSSFSLPALEELLRSNQQMVAAQEMHARTISTLQADFAASAAASQQYAVRTAQVEKDLEFATARAAAAEAEAAELRTALRRCDEQRMQFRCTLAALRGEFEQSSRTWFQAVAAHEGDGAQMGEVAAPGAASQQGEGAVAVASVATAAQRSRVGEPLTAAGGRSGSAVQAGRSGGMVPSLNLPSGPGMGEIRLRQQQQQQQQSLESDFKSKVVLDPLQQQDGRRA